MLSNLVNKIKNWNNKRIAKSYPIDIQNFILKYGSHCAHYKYKSKNTKDQIEFLELYTKYLAVNSSFEKTLLMEYDSQFSSPVMSLFTKDGTVFHVFFSKENGQVVQIGKNADGSESYGYLNISFEINLPYHCR